MESDKNTEALDELIERLEHLKSGFEKIRDAALNLSLSENLSDFRNGVRMNTKLTEYQNQRITDVLCKMSLDGETPDKIKDARRLLEKQMLKLNAKSIPRL